MARYGEKQNYQLENELQTHSNKMVQVFLSNNRTPDK